MNVVQVINAASVSNVCRFYALHWNDDEWARPENFLRFKALLNDTVGFCGKMAAVVEPLMDDLDGSRLYAL